MELCEERPDLLGNHGARNEGAIGLDAANEAVADKWVGELLRRRAQVVESWHDTAEDRSDPADDFQLSEEPRHALGTLWESEHAFVVTEDEQLVVPPRAESPAGRAAQLGELGRDDAGNPLCVESPVRGAVGHVLPDAPVVATIESILPSMACYPSPSG